MANTSVGNKLAKIVQATALGAALAGSASAQGVQCGTTPAKTAKEQEKCAQEFRTHVKNGNIAPAEVYLVSKDKKDTTFAGFFKISTDGPFRAAAAPGVYGGLAMFTDIEGIPKDIPDRGEMIFVHPNNRQKIAISSGAIKRGAKQLTDYNTLTLDKRVRNNVQVLDLEAAGKGTFGTDDKYLRRGTALMTMSAICDGKPYSIPGRLDLYKFDERLLAEAQKERAAPVTSVNQDSVKKALYEVARRDSVAKATRDSIAKETARLDSIAKAARDKAAKQSSQLRGNIYIAGAGTMIRETQQPSEKADMEFNAGYRSAERETNGRSGGVSVGGILGTKTFVVDFAGQLAKYSAKVNVNGNEYVPSSEKDVTSTSFVGKADFHLAAPGKFGGFAAVNCQGNQTKTANDVGNGTISMDRVQMAIGIERALSADKRFSAFYKKTEVDGASDLSETFNGVGVQLVQLPIEQPLGFKFAYAIQKGNKLKSFQNVVNTINADVTYSKGALFAGAGLEYRSQSGATDRPYFEGRVLFGGQIALPGGKK